MNEGLCNQNLSSLGNAISAWSPDFGQYVVNEMTSGVSNILITEVLKDWYTNRLCT